MTKVFLLISYDRNYEGREPAVEAVFSTREAAETERAAIEEERRLFKAIIPANLRPEAFVNDDELVVEEVELNVGPVREYGNVPYITDAEAREFMGRAKAAGLLASTGESADEIALAALRQETQALFLEREEDAKNKSRNVQFRDFA